MADFRVISFRKELLDKFQYNGTEVNLFGRQILPTVEYYAKLGKVYCGIAEGKTVVIGGIFPMWKGVGSAFLFVNQEAKNYKIGLFKALLKYINKLIKKYKIKTLIAECFDDNPQAHNLLKHLGFNKTKEIKISVYFKGANL